MKTANIYDPGATENDYLFMFNGEPVSGTGPVPTGTIQITSNGQHDVSDYATADVNVPQGITPSGSKSITENGTYDVTQYASAVVNVPQGGGSTLIASGTFTGDGSNPSNYWSGVNVGAKMPTTDFYFLIKLRDSTEVSNDTDNKYAWCYLECRKSICHYNLSSAGLNKGAVSDYSFNVVGTTVQVGEAICDCYTIKSQTMVYTHANNARIDMDSEKFNIRLYYSNPVFKYINGAVYDWELVYFGSDPTNDIVDLGG